MANPASALVAPLNRRGMAIVCVGVGLLLLALSGRYGYHRDELYFLACGRHLAWGYPDQGPLVPLVARLADIVAPGSVVLLRLPATLATVAVAALSGLTARELGGRSFAQLFATLVVGTGAVILGIGHLLVTATLDVLVWALAIYLVVRILRTGDQRLWILVGLVLGIGLLNKALPAVLGLGLAAGVLLTPQARPALRSRWPYLGALIALVIWAPYLLWQQAHGWPQVTLAHEIGQEFSQPGERINFVILQIVMVGPFGAWVAIRGLRQLWRERRASPYTVLAWTWLVALVVFVVTAGQGYYTAGVYPALVAAGAVAIERRRHRPRLLLTVTVLLALVPLPSSLPLLSPQALAASPWKTFGDNQLETFGWPQFVTQVAGVYAGLSAGDRARTTIFTENYGEAGSIAQFGPAHGLPAAYSGINAYGLWGPPPERDTSVIVVAEDGPPDPVFRACHPAGRVREGASIDNEEQDSAAIFVCAAPASGWAAAWPGLRHLSS